MTEDEWDSNKIYGLTLPRIVANNRCTRELGIEGLPVFDVPLVSVIGQQHENWALRMMAHGRRVSWENFRSRQVFAGILLRLIRGDLVSPDGQDFVTIMNAEHKKRHPQKELHDWEARYDTLKHVAEELAVEFRKRAPVRANAALLGRLQELEIENAALKRPSSTSTPPGRKATLKSSASVPTSSDKSGKGSTKRRLPFHEAPAGPEHDPLHGLMDEEEGNPDDVPTEPMTPPLEDQTFGDEDAEDPNSTYARFLCSSESQRFLESCSITKFNITSVNQWLAGTRLGKSKKKALDLALSEFTAAAGKLDAGSKRPVDSTAVEWGLSVTLAAKLNKACLTRLIAGAHLLSQE